MRQVLAQRREVGDAILDATASLVVEHGLRAVTLPQIAEAIGIGRATLYKYFPDVESILIAWHERHVSACSNQLRAIRNWAGDPDKRLRAVLETYAHVRHQHNDPDLAPLCHRGKDLERAHQQLTELVCELHERGDSGRVRSWRCPADRAGTLLSIRLARGSDLAFGTGGVSARRSHARGAAAIC